MKPTKFSRKKIIKYLLISIFLITYIILLYIHILLFIDGLTSIISIFLFYFTLILFIILLLFGLSSFIRFIRQRRKEFILFSVTLFTLFFLVELLLKYAIGTYQGYLEKNGSFFFHSYYRQINWENRNYKEGTHKEKVWYWFHAPNARWKDSKPEFSFDYTINAAGARDREFILIKAPDEYRVITVGDSYTEGVGTSQDSTYPHFLENKLAQYYPGRHITVYNGGCSGSDPFYEYILLRDKLLQYSPDLVIVGINSSDIQDILVRGGMERFMPDGTVKYRTPPAWEPIYCLSYIARHIIHDLCGYNWMFVKNKETEAMDMKAMREINYAVGLFTELSIARKFRLLIVVHPTKYELKENYFPMRKLPVMLMKNEKVEVLNLNEYFSQKARENKANYLTYFWEIDGHNTAKGYELFAQGVAKKIIDLDWVSQQSKER